jgi:hypothetical protein
VAGHVATRACRSPSLQVCHDLLDPLADRPVKLADHQGARTTIGDHPGLDQVGEEIHERRDSPRSADGGRDLWLAQAVLQA